MFGLNPAGTMHIPGGFRTIFLRENQLQNVGRTLRGRTREYSLFPMSPAQPFAQNAASLSQVAAASRLPADNIPNRCLPDLRDTEVPSHSTEGRVVLPQEKQPVGSNILEGKP